MRERSERLKGHIHGLLDAGVRSTLFHRFLRESLDATQGELRAIRRAKAFAHLLDRVEQVVLPYELVPGSILGLWPLAEDLPSPEARLAGARLLVREHLARKDASTGSRRGVSRWALMGRDHYDANITFGDLQKIARTLEAEFVATGALTYSALYRLLENHFSFDYGEDRRRVDALPWFAANHLHLDYKSALRRGLGGLLQDVVCRKAEAADPARAEFYESVRIALEAAIRFIQRYAATLRGEADRPATGAARAAELRQAAAVCTLVAEHRPQTFREAIQLVWMLHVIANIGGGTALSLGRFDRYLAPFYDRDVAAGCLTREQAKEWIECIWLKVNEPKMRTVQSLCVGGVAPDGSDGTHELSYICLEIAAEAHEPYPNTCVRVHGGMPEALWDRITQSIMAGGGQPQVFNDDVMLPGLEQLGFPPADARQYYPMGCVEIMLEGLQPTYQGSGTVVFPGLLEHVFNNGAANYAGETGAATGPLSALATFDDFLAAFLAQVRHGVVTLLTGREKQWRDAARVQTDPFASALVDGCIESGVDCCQGGARYPRWFVTNSMGFGTAVDALSAIRLFVYERKQYTLEQMRDMLDRDFEGCEAVRGMLATRTPAYGNDRAEVDAMARRVYDAFTLAVRSFPSAIGAVHSPQMFSYTSHVYRGEVTGATADGRRRGTAFSDGLGPAQGRDVCGPTCLINSVTQMDYSRLTGGCGFNLKISPDFVSGPGGGAILKSLLKTYVAKGGLQIQVNMVDQDSLRKAQANPESYRNLVVRVAGFCEYFTSLDRKLQDEIIARTAQDPAVRPA